MKLITEILQSPIDLKTKIESLYALETAGKLLELRNEICAFIAKLSAAKVE
jgi:hypothetical protein